MADHDRFERDRYGRRERGFAGRARDEVRSWLGDEEAAQRRRMDEHERWETDNRQRHRSSDRWAAGSSAWGRDDSDASGREYGDRDYGWSRDRERSRNWSPSGDYDRGDMPVSSFEHEPGSRRFDYTRPEQTEYGRQAYGAQYAGQRPAREWSGERWRVPGPHVGRGPRGYQRSDDRIREEINDRLTAHGHIDATDIDCTVQGGEVTLAGFVDSRAAKRAAEDVAEDVPGVREVHNQLRVRSHAPDEGVGRTSVLGITESQVQTRAVADAPNDRSKGR